MFSWAIVLLVSAVVAVGQALLLRSAWRFRHHPAEPPPGVPRSDPRGDIAWTLLTALATALVLAFVVRSLL